MIVFRAVGAMIVAMSVALLLGVPRRPAIPVVFRAAGAIIVAMSVALLLGVPRRPAILLDLSTSR